MAHEKEKMKQEKVFVLSDNTKKNILGHMKALIQRVSEASVSVNDKTIGSIDRGLVIFLGITQTDTEREGDVIVEKIANLRLFPHEQQEFDKSATDENLPILIVSQFTLYGACEKGRRPDFASAAKSEQAKPLYDYVTKQLRAKGLQVEEGEFGAHMQVSLINDGPATFFIEKNAITT